ncbi:hypothetical protein [Alicyclobacillus mengziensis]|uniref:Uncharacterized protein n=1 Tax=Alicyclobacillus mengziensis TaxID=2931921 RepID=A0A9X7VZ28_9BACL|nr:hypothetical protein [Alicyclobacillus mengziensis]QSO47369.1 hypothetical protein JZ786_23775 [Alicyclobacillus mengziensis]
MNKKQMERWEKVRARGKKRFILRYGVFGWGLSSGILFGILMMLEGSENITPVNWILNILLFMIFGYVWGLLMWSWTERKYQREQK